MSAPAPGATKTVAYCGKSVWIVRRTEETMVDLATLDDRLVDSSLEVKSQQPASAQNATRLINLEIPPHSYLSDNRLLLGEDGAA